VNKKITRVFILSTFITLAILAAVYAGYINGIFAKETIYVICSEKKITWEFKDEKAIKNGCFVLYRNGKEVYRGDEFEYINPYLEDIEKPESIEDISLIYERDKIILDWEEPADKGTDNSLEVYFINRLGMKIFRSNELVYNYSSGISKYILNIGGSTFETTDSRIEIDYEELDSGLLDTSVIAVDKNGNESIPEILVSVRNIRLDVIDQDGKLTIINSDKEQDYTYKIHINNKEIELDGNTIDYKDIFTDTAPPEMPIVKISIEPECVVLMWDPVKSVSKIYKFHIEGLGSKYNNRVYSEEFVKISNIKGYYFSINNEESHTITYEDILINDPDQRFLIIFTSSLPGLKEGLNISDNSSISFMIDTNSVEHPLYIHIASVDNILNISETFTCEIPIPSKYKLKRVEPFFVKADKEYQSRYEDEKKHLALLPENIIDFLLKHNLRIYFVDEQKLYDSVTDTQYDGYYYGDSNSIELSKTGLKSIVLHEVGHSIDYLMPDYLGFSSEEDKEFINIYKKEKDILYNDNSYPRSTPAEYFAEAFQDYFINRMSLMEKAPLTYKYIDKLVKNIK